MTSIESNFPGGATKRQAVDPLSAKLGRGIIIPLGLSLKSVVIVLSDHSLCLLSYCVSRSVYFFP
jgi:hypothetical protein